ncbi:MAG: diphthine--ammonia ligase [Nanoarchaeota archaeon]
MKLGVLFSGGKDSMYAAYLAKKNGYELCCLLSIFSENKESFMFHTPSIKQVEKQAMAMGAQLVALKTQGEKEKELKDLEKLIKKAIREHAIEGIVTGAVGSVYQATRIQEICNKLEIACFNPLWQKNQIELLEELLQNKFEIIITGVSAFPFDQRWLGRKIDMQFIDEVKTLEKKYGINPAGEGGEFESFVLDCPLFQRRLKVIDFEDFGEGNSWRREVKVA